MKDETHEHDSTDSPLGVLGRRRRPPFARLLGARRPADRPVPRTRLRIRTRARRIGRLGRDATPDDDASTDATRTRPTPFSYLRLGDLLGVGASESRRGSDPTSTDSDPPTAGDSSPTATDPTRLSVTRRITVTRDIDSSATEGGSRRPAGAGDRATTLRLPTTESVGDDRRESPTASNRRSATTGESHRRQTGTGHERADRRRITTVRPTRPRPPVDSSIRTVRPMTRGRRSVAVLSSVGDAPVARDSTLGDRPADTGLPTPTAGRRGAPADTRPGFGTSESALSVSAAGAVGTGRADVPGGRPGPAAGATGRTGRSGPLGAETREPTAGTAARTVTDEPSLVVASRESETETGSGPGGNTSGERGDPNSSGGRGSGSAHSTGSSAAEPEPTPTGPATADGEADPVTLPSATVDRIVDRLSRRLQRDRRIARERGER